MIEYEIDQFKCFKMVSIVNNNRFPLLNYNFESPAENNKIGIHVNVNNIK